MEGAARVFAGEFNRSTLTVQKAGSQGSTFVVTPGGAWCRLMFVCGALTEVTDHGDMLHCRISDPTGTFDVVIRGFGTELFTMAKKIPVPSFLAVVGIAQMHQRNGVYTLSVRPESIQIVDRTVRDLWIVRTADLTLRRLEDLANALDKRSENPEMQVVTGHYAITQEHLRDLVLMAESALSTVRTSVPPAQQQVNPRELITTILQEHQGTRGIAIEEIISHAGPAGLSLDAAKAAIEEMIREDECYQPQKGFIKLL
jgi:RPA family protein